MEAVWWRGKVIPDNRRLIWGKQKRMVPNPKYKAFKESLAWEIKVACKKKYERISLMPATPRKEEDEIFIVIRGEGP